MIFIAVYAIVMSLDMCATEMSIGYKGGYWEDILPHVRNFPSVMKLRAISEYKVSSKNIYGDKIWKDKIIFTNTTIK